MIAVAEPASPPAPPARADIPSPASGPGSAPAAGFAPTARGTAWARRGRGVRLGVHLAPEAMTVVAARGLPWRLRPTVVLRVPLAPPVDERWPALADALAALRARYAGGEGRLTLDVALARPLAHAKVVTLPRTRGRDVAALLRRNVRRFFLLPPDALLADARPLAGSWRGPERRALAVAAPERLVHAVFDAAASAGVRVERITAAPVAVAAALRELAPAVGARVLVVAADAGAGDAAELTVVRGGSVLLAQPVTLPPVERRSSEGPSYEAPTLGPAIVADDATIADWAAATAHAADSFAGRLDAVAVLAPDAPHAGALDAALGRHVRRGGWLHTRRHARVQAQLHAARVLGAAGVTAFGAARLGAAAPLLLPEAARRLLDRRARRRAAARAAAAGVQLVAAAGVYRWGLERELDATTARRVALAPAVTRTLAVRGDVARTSAALAALVDAAAGTHRHVAFVAALAEALPESAYVVSLTADSDRVQLEGLAPSASPVLPALRAVDGVVGASFAAPIRRDEASGYERFDVSLILRPAPSTNVARQGAAARSAP